MHPFPINIISVKTCSCLKFQLLMLKVALKKFILFHTTKMFLLRFFFFFFPPLQVHHTHPQQMCYSHSTNCLQSRWQYSIGSVWWWHHLALGPYQINMASLLTNLPHLLTLRRSHNTCCCCRAYQASTANPNGLLPSAVVLGEADTCNHVSSTPSSHSAVLYFFTHLSHPHFFFIIDNFIKIN